MIILLGYKTRSRFEEPSVVYCGRDGVAAQKAVDESPFPRIEKLNHPPMMPVRRWDEARAKAMQEAEQAKSAEQNLQSEKGKAKSGKSPVPKEAPAPAPEPEPEVEPVPEINATEDGPQLQLPAE